MTCNFVCAASWVVFPVGLVEPVELRGIRAAMWDRRGTGGTDVRLAHAARMEILLLVLPVPPTGPSKINKTVCSTTGSTRSPESATVLSAS